MRSLPLSHELIIIISSLDLYFTEESRGIHKYIVSQFATALGKASGIFYISDDMAYNIISLYYVRSREK